MKKQFASLALALLTLAILPLNAHSAAIVQTVNSTDDTTAWNAALWGSPSAVPTGGNDYTTATGFFTATPTTLGGDVTGRVRAYGNDKTFSGNSLTIVSSTELLLKADGSSYNTFSANLILDGGYIRYNPKTSGDAGLEGTIHVAADSVIGLRAGTGNEFTVGSIITGSQALRLTNGSASSSGETLKFDDGVGTSLNGFAGTFDIGGGDENVIVDFAQDYTMTLAGLTMGNYTTTDILNLSHNISVGSFSYGATSFGAGTYTVAQLNADAGNGSQFTGTGSLTVVPEPGSFAMLLGGLGLLSLLRRRRAVC